MFKFFFIYILLIFSSANLFSQDVQFFREKIVMEIFDSGCHLKGIYYLKNETEKPIVKNLFYPFIVNEKLPYPDSIKVVDWVDKEAIDFRNSLKGIFFTAYIPKLSIKIYQVDYYQKAPHNYMEYILTTTKFWGNPFDIAEYEIKIPLRYKIKYLSMNYLDKNVENGKQILYVMKKEFMPGKNLIIKWED